MSVAEELWDQLVYLSDPEVKWVRRTPKEGEACLAFRGGYPVAWELSWDARTLLVGVIPAELDRAMWRGATAVDWHDDRCKSREQALHVLEEAYWWAKEEGL